MVHGLDMVQMTTTGYILGMVSAQAKPIFSKNNTILQLTLRFSPILYVSHLFPYPIRPI